MSEPIPVLLTLKSRQDCGGESEETELFTEGTLRQTPEGWEIAYEESELTGMSGVRTRFHLTEGRAVLHRGGGIETRMVFEEGAPHPTAASPWRRRPSASAGGWAPTAGSWSSATA